MDFDGTITRWDTLDALVLQYACDDSWQKIERQWQAGSIGSRECLSQEFSLIRISEPALDRFLDAIEIDPGFLTLLHLLDQHQVPRAILSDGIDRFILHVLNRLQRKEIVRSNAISRDGLTMTLQCPHASSQCSSAAAHCKCSSMQSLATDERQSIYIGDGRSDLCPARRADFIFAKGKLAEALSQEGRHFIPFHRLDDVARILKSQWERVP